VSVGKISDTIFDILMISYSFWIICRIWKFHKNINYS